MVRLWGQIIISLFFDKLTAKVISRILGENIKFIFTSRVMGEIFIEEFLFFPRRCPSRTLKRAGSEGFKATIFQQKIILYMYILNLRIASI